MSLPLDGRRILVTREAEKAAETARAIESRGGVAVSFPCIATFPPVDAGPLRAALAGLSAYDRVVVSSPTGARVLVEGVAPGALGPGALGATRLYAVGRATARTLEAAGARDVAVPDRQDGDGLLERLQADGAGAGRTLVLRAEQGREVVVAGLQAVGAAVDAVVAYRTARAVPEPGAVEALLAQPPVDAALFLSPSALEGFLGILGDERARAVLGDALTVAIGRTTASCMLCRGFPPGLVPDRPDLEAVLDAVAARLGPRVR